jgi:hypothetical protein
MPTIDLTDDELAAVTAAIRRLIDEESRPCSDDNQSPTLSTVSAHFGRRPTSLRVRLGASGRRSNRAGSLMSPAPRKAGVRAEAAIGSRATSAASLQHDILEPQPRTRRRWVRSAALANSSSGGRVVVIHDRFQRLDSVRGVLFGGGFDVYDCRFGFELQPLETDHPETTHLTATCSCEACSAFTRVAARTLARSPIRDLLHRRLQPFCYLHDCSGCFRLERLPGGACTHWKAPLCHGAHVKRTLRRVNAC